ncbi:MAG: lasso peptide biosynthesis PqqD family chaperone [Clostridiaceae bacterium]
MMIDKNTIVSILGDIDVTDLNGEKVMMNFESGQYFVLNDVASRIWELIESPIIVNEVINSLLKEYDIDNKSCETAVINFLSRLDYAKLICVS